jgi:hypothetical protein
LILKFLQIIKTINIRTHDSEAALFKSNIAITEIKNRARNTLESTSNIINECTSSISQAANVHIYIYYKQMDFFLNFIKHSKYIFYLIREH